MVVCNCGGGTVVSGRCLWRWSGVTFSRSGVVVRRGALCSSCSALCNNFMRCVLVLKLIVFLGGELVDGLLEVHIS